MKSTTILLLSGLTTLSSCKENGSRNGKSKWLPDVTNKDHGPLQQKEFSGDFDAVEVSQAIEAEIIKSDVEKVVISAPANIINEILVDNKGGELHIHYKTGFRVMNTNNVKAKIYAKDFSKLEANSAAIIVVRDQFTQGKTDVEVSSSGHISGKLEANELDIDAGSSGTFKGNIWAVNLNVEASSSGEVAISGKAENAVLNSSSGSNISAKEVVAKNVKAESSSGATVEITVSTKFEAHASSGGSIHGFKKGNVTTVSKEESSGGSVILQ
ncbi:head GIN domain-containing protein [Chryseobacterium sp.]|uniref:head GIN domain-containing protein n=1 Tax=Chryseobacterium sp. TaxID=1871047 RepID=UPI00289EEFCA|nr:head GIN domain-containing protein [Chryseobacterium sp.]